MNIRTARKTLVNPADFTASDICVFVSNEVGGSAVHSNRQGGALPISKRDALGLIDFHSLAPIGKKYTDGTCYVQAS